MLSWARMKLKPAKSLSIQKGRGMDSVSFQVAEERIPVLVVSSIRTLSREYTAHLTNRHVKAPVAGKLKEGLKQIDQSSFRDIQVWCY